MSIINTDTITVNINEDDKQLDLFEYELPLSIDTNNTQLNDTLSMMGTVTTVTLNGSDYQYDTLASIGSIDIGNMTFDYTHTNSQGISISENADITLGDKSLKEFMKNVEERLAIFRVNPELEERWDELKELGKRYKELEKEILEKEKIWGILKK